MGDKARRQQRIIELLEEEGRAETAALALRLGVTELTIRRDIDQLDEQGVVRRVYGGAVLNSGSSFEPPFAMRLKTNVDGKKAIAAAAVRLVPRGANISIDFGTKAYYLALEMRRRHVQVLAAPTSVQVIEVLGQDPDIRILAPSGTVKSGELSLRGSSTEHFFRERRWDLAFVGVAGINADKNLMSDFDEADARLKATMIGSADRVVVLAEAKHLGALSFAPVAPLDPVTTVVTDARGDNETLAALEQRGIEVIRAAETS
ncbi:DeoR/GlpR family DNA-binding transcription regulator [Microbacterium oryzae]|uniref:DeoR/GlpR family DNA-binding transcription regulator n=1 Tax=Microbacterium oryzae TaxID=743009 RepID=UPI0025AF97C9|nr:DeoR/GlpR family DNA-binding transcription regulator [Microbacterium oryzae]MDN3310178.1 DeoR/GlpR family DNA-binding transcription regulator [Microbacterium oryzae]